MDKKEIITSSDAEELVKAIEIVKALYSLKEGESLRIEITKCNCQVISDNKIEEEPKSIEIRIYKFLAEIGIPSNIKGYNYIKTALMLAYNDSSILENITKVLYSEIAKKYDTTSSRVERAIRHAIEVACTKGNVELINKIFKYSISVNKGKPTNSEFIAQTINAMQMNLI